MNFEGSAKKLYTLPWQALYDLAVEKQIDAEEIKHKEKTEIIRRVLLSDITEAEIEAVIDDYTYGNRVTFTLWGFSKTLSVEDISALKALEQTEEDYIDVEGFRNLKYVSLKTCSDRLEMIYSYSKEYSFINEEGKADSVWEMHQGCLWIGTEKNYLASISTSTNSQSAVKARDLRSNDKAVLAMKRAYEQYFPDGYFVTKRGERVDTVKYNTAHVVNLTDLGKQLIAWHSQRPTISYSETKIFDKYFDQLFHRDYAPENVQALNVMFAAVYEKWGKENPMGLNETLLAMKAYAPYHQLFAISVILCEINKMNDSVPNPSVALRKMTESGLLDYIVEMAGNCLNMAMETAQDTVAADTGKLFVPQNWIKSKASLKDIRVAVKQMVASLKMLPDGKKVLARLNEGLAMNKEDFEARWTAD